MLTAEQTKSVSSAAAAFVQPSDRIHVIEVDGSWGAGQNGNLDIGGVQTRQFLYNERTGKWADVNGDQISPQPVGPYGGHPVEGIYRPRSSAKG